MKKFSEHKTLSSRTRSGSNRTTSQHIYIPAFILKLLRKVSFLFVNQFMVPECKKLTEKVAKYLHEIYGSKMAPNFFILKNNICKIMWQTFHIQAVLVDLIYFQTWYLSYLSVNLLSQVTVEALN